VPFYSYRLASTAISSNKGAAVLGCEFDSVGSFEELDRITRRVVQQNLFAARSCDNVVAKVHSSRAKSSYLRGNIIYEQMNTIPAFWNRPPAIGHGSSRRSNRLSHTSRTEGVFGKTVCLAARRQCAIDCDRRYRTHAQRLRTLRDLRISHVEHDHLAGRAGDTLDRLHRLVTTGAPCGKNLDLSLRHFDSP
jgi:hypothetical protein